MSRKLCLDLCDYSRKVLYPIYNNEVKLPGEATNVIVSTERNGWRELSFNMPTLCQTENGTEDNAALQYLKNDFLIRLTDDEGVDWFIISEPKITHNGFQKSVQVTAGHISQLLKVKNLGLEFSDEEGNNVGTAAELAATILEGTGWTLGNVYEFKEKRSNDVKRRSLKAAAKTGAFKLMSTMCDLFEAKPVYHGDTKTVDIIPINPFSAPEPGQLPNLELANGIIELHYGKNLKNVTRSMNSENIVTRLYAYGSYGDKTSGYCAMDECTHTEYRFKISEGLVNGTVYWFSVPDDNGVNIARCFKAMHGINSGHTLVYSIMDPASMLYVWDEQNHFAYPVSPENIPDDPNKNLLNFCQGNQYETAEVRNYFSFLMDFDYYRQNGMLSDEMIQKLAEYQRMAPEKYQETLDAANTLTESQGELSKIVGTVNLCKLAVSQIAAGDGEDEGYTKIVLDKSVYPDGVIYRSDYDRNKKNQFKWNTTLQLNDKGDPIGASAMLYIIQTKDGNGNPLDAYTYQHVWLRRVDDEDNPSEITIWLPAAEMNSIKTTDQFLLVSPSTNGYLGSIESLDESAQQSDSTTTKITEEHPIVFVDSSVQVDNLSVDDVNNYGWLWQYDFSVNPETKYITHNESKMYFCYKAKGDDKWKRAYYDNREPQDIDSGSSVYWFNWEKGVLSRFENGVWVQMLADPGATVDNYNPETGEIQNFSSGSEEEQTIGSQFGAVHLICENRDRYWQGVSERTVYTVPERTVADNGTVIETGNLSPGNYAIDTGFGYYRIFTIKDLLHTGDTLTYVYTGADPQTNGYVIQKKDGYEKPIETVKSYPKDIVTIHPDNVLDGLVIQEGSIVIQNNQDGTQQLMENSDNGVRLQGRARVIPNTIYQVLNLSNAGKDYYNKITIHFFTDNGLFIQNASTGLSDGRFTTPSNARYIRFSINENGLTLREFEDYIANPIIRALNRENRFVIEDLTYTILRGAQPSGRNVGLIDLIRRFLEYADQTYGEAYAAMLAKQQEIKSTETDMITVMGDLFREGYWQDDSYVDGDEERLYDDAMENLKKIAFPNTTYNIGFLDLYDSNTGDEEYAADKDTLHVSWPDISISSAVHLVDPEIGINTWGFIDKIQKCYDKPWTTTISVNTNLTTLAQHSFADVMTNIANVSNTVKGRLTKYDSAVSGGITYSQYDDILSNLVTLSKVQESAGGRLTEMENAITNHSSSILQTANMIQQEVQRAIGNEIQLSSRITQTDEGITQTVNSRVTQAIEDAGLSAYDVQISSPSGNFITEDIQSLTLNAVVLYGYDQTNQLDNTGSDYEVSSDNVNWFTTDANGAWTEIQPNVESEPGVIDKTKLLVTASDIGDQRSYRLGVTINGNVLYAQFTAANISKINQLELYLASSLPAVQTHARGAQGAYAPDWSQTNLVITPTLYFNGTKILNGSGDIAYQWSRSVDGGAFSAVSDVNHEYVSSQALSEAYGSLTVTENVLDSGTLTYRCQATYNGSTIRAEKTFSVLKTEFSTDSCKLSGQQVFKYNKNGTPNSNTIDLLATVNGCTVTTWEYWNAQSNTWVTYPNKTNVQLASNSLSISHTDAVFYNDTAHIRVRTTKAAEDPNQQDEEGPSDSMNIFKVYDGTETPRVFLSSDNITFLADTHGRITQGEKKTVKAMGYVGSVVAKPATPARAIVVNNPDLTVTLGEQGDGPGELTVSVEANKDTNLGTDTDTQGQILISFSSPVVTTLTLNWTKLNSGGPGKGIDSMVTYYTKSPRNSTPNSDCYPETTLTINDVATNILSVFGHPVNGDPTLGIMILGAASLWQTQVPQMDPAERYLWAYDEITYTDGSEPVVTQQRIVGIYGEGAKAGLVCGIHTPYGEVFKQDTVALETTAYAYEGTDSALPACTFDWDYYYGGEWIEAHHNGAYTYSWPLDWLREHCPGGATMRCTIHYGGADYLAYCNLIDKTDNYQAIVVSSTGDSFYDGESSLTIHCRLYQGGNEVDTDGSAFVYRWTRLDSSGNEMEDEYRSGKTIIVQPSDIQGTTTFVCHATSVNGGYSAQGQTTVNRSQGIFYSSAPPENPAVNMLWMDTSDPDANSLYRWDGEQFVQVAGDPDQIKNLQAVIEEHSATIQTLSDRIDLEVKERLNEYESQYNAFVTKTYTSDMQLTSKNIEMQVSQITNDPDITGAINYTQQITSWMKFDINGLELGKNVLNNGVDDGVASKFRARLTPEKLSFIESDAEVAYFSGRSMYITDARITNQLNLGSDRETDEGGWYKHQMMPKGLVISWAADQFAKYRFHGQIEYPDNPTNNIDDYSNCFAFDIRRTDMEGTVISSQQLYYHQTAENYGTQIYFDTIVFDQPGTYWYRISQVRNGVYGDTSDPVTRDGRVEYDTTNYIVQITVERENPSVPKSPLAVTDALFRNVNDLEYQQLNNDVGNLSIAFTNHYIENEATSGNGGE